MLRRIGRFDSADAGAFALLGSFLLALGCSQNSGDDDSGGAGTAGAPGAGTTGMAGSAPTGGTGGAPPGSGDPAACSSCMKSSCASELGTCQGDAACKACTDCMLAQANLGSCVLMGLCNFQSPQDPTGAALGCAIMKCDAPCGLAE